MRTFKPSECPFSPPAACCISSHMPSSHGASLSRLRLISVTSPLPSPHVCPVQAPGACARLPVGGGGWSEDAGVQRLAAVGHGVCCAGMGTTGKGMGGWAGGTGGVAFVGERGTGMKVASAPVIAGGRGWRCTSTCSTPPLPSFASSSFESTPLRPPAPRTPLLSRQLL